MNRMLLEKPQLVVTGGRPTAVILDIHAYEELLECVEDAAHLAELRRMRRRPLKFRSFQEFLKEQKNV